MAKATVFEKRAARTRRCRAARVQRLVTKTRKPLAGAKAGGAVGPGFGLDAEWGRRRTAGGGPYPDRRSRREKLRLRHRYRGSDLGYEYPRRTCGPYGGIAVARAHAAIGREGTYSGRAAAVMERRFRHALSLANVFAHAADAYGRQGKDEKHLNECDAAEDGGAAPHYRGSVLMEPRVGVLVNSGAEVWSGGGGG